MGRRGARNRRLAATLAHLQPCASSELPGADVVDELFADFFRDGSAPGVAFGVVVDGELVHSGGIGTLRVGEDATPGADSIFRIASMSKSFVAATVLLLRDDGVLQLDDPVERWVPELAGLPLATADSPPPTLRHLLSMNGGYPEDDPWADRLESLPDDEYTALIGEPKTQARPAGVAYEYSNLGFTLLGRVIQNAAGCASAPAMLDYISERIMKPLGMTDTAWSDDHLDKARLAAGYHLVDDDWIPQPIQKPGAFSALGGVYSSVADLAVWVGGFIDAWPPRDEPDNHPLSRASRREMQKIHSTMPLDLGADGPELHGYCLGLTSEETFSSGRIIGHSGGYPGFGSRMAWHPESKVGVIGLANGRYGGPYGTVPLAVKAVAAEVMEANMVVPLTIEAHASVAEIRATIDAALMAGDFAQLEHVLSLNVDMDEELSRRGAFNSHCRAPLLQLQVLSTRCIQVSYCEIEHLSER